MKSVLLVVCLSVCAFGRGHHHHGDGEGETMPDGWKEGDDLVLMNFDDECIHLIDVMIQDQLESVYQYMAMATFFRRYDVDIVGMSLMYNSWSRMKLDMAKELMMMVVKRGGTIEFRDIMKPKQTEFNGPADALMTSLKMERGMMRLITYLAKRAREHNDLHLTAFLEKNMVNAQTDYIFEVAAYISKLEKMGAKMGLMAMNNQMVKKYKDFMVCESDAEKFKWNY